jgi:hypothetical protein
MRPPTEVPQTGDRAGASKAVQRLVDRMGERDRIILYARAWSARTQSLRTVAERFGGVHTVSVSINQPRAQARFVELLADPAHHEVSKYASALRGRVGPQMLADLKLVIAYRKYLHARFPFPTWNIAGLPSTTCRS